MKNGWKWKATYVSGKGMNFYWSTRAKTKVDFNGGAAGGREWGDKMASIRLMDVPCIYHSCTSVCIWTSSATFRPYCVNWAIIIIPDDCVVVCSSEASMWKAAMLFHLWWNAGKISKSQYKLERGHGWQWKFSKGLRKLVLKIAYFPNLVKNNSMVL